MATTEEKPRPCLDVGAGDASELPCAGIRLCVHQSILGGIGFLVCSAQERNLHFVVSVLQISVLWQILQLSRAGVDLGQSSHLLEARCCVCQCCSAPAAGRHSFGALTLTLLLLSSGARFSQ